CHFPIVNPDSSFTSYRALYTSFLILICHFFYYFLTCILFHFLLCLFPYKESVQQFQNRPGKQLDTAQDEENSAGHHGRVKEEKYNPCYKPDTGHQIVDG